MRTVTVFIPNGILIKNDNIHISINRLSFEPIREQLKEYETELYSIPIIQKQVGIVGKSRYN